MTYAEALAWGAYFKKNGYASAPAGLVPQLQRGFALMASTLVNVHGGFKGGRTATIEDFMPQTSDQEGDVAEVAALLSSLWSGADKPKRKLWKRPGK